MAEYDNENTYSAVEFMFKHQDGRDLDSLWTLLEDWLGDCSEDECTCGMVHLGGCTGTEEQCWKQLGSHESQALVLVDDLKLILRLVKDPELRNFSDLEHRNVSEAYERLRKEAYWHDEFDEWLVGVREAEKALETKHLEHYRSCNCLGGSAICCVADCECKEDE